MSASGSTSGAPKTGGSGRSRSGSASGHRPGQSKSAVGFDRSKYPLRDKEGVSKRLDLPPEAYYHVSLNLNIPLNHVLTIL